MTSAYNIINTIIPLYKDYQPILKRYDWDRMETDEKYALISFFNIYALERSGSTKAQKLACLKFISKYFPIYKNFTIDEIKIKFFEFLSDKVNTALNPILSETIKKLSISDVISLIRKRNYKDAYEKLIEQKGIGAKISNLFLRDASLVFHPEDKLNLQEAIYLFPIDVWVRDFIAYFNLQHTNLSEIKKPKNMQTNYLKMSMQFCDFCIRNEFDPRIVNSSMWTFAASYAGNTKRLYQLIKDGENAIKAEIQLIKTFMEEIL